MGKEEKQLNNPPSDFDYATFREHAIARMQSGDKEPMGKDSILAPLL